jgi:predicted metal-binding membrane protein
MTTHRALDRKDPALWAWVAASTCWATTIALSVTGVMRAGHHDIVLHSSGAWLVRLAMFGAVWLVMIGAMMLPTTTTMLRYFWVVSARAPRPLGPRAALLASYLTVWLLFAFAALAGDKLIHETVQHSRWLADRSGLILAGALLLAGMFQFSGLKDRCLTRCRSPFSFLAGGYRRGVVAAWNVGVRHGLSCLGCCWALMLLMFATGVGSLGWMLALTAVMVGEKTAHWGYQLVKPVGFVLLASGAVISLATLLGVPA